MRAYRDYFYQTQNSQTAHWACSWEELMNSEIEAIQMNSAHAISLIKSEMNHHGWYCVFKCCVEKAKRCHRASIVQVKSEWEWELFSGTEMILIYFLVHSARQFSCFWMIPGLTWEPVPSGVVAYYLGKPLLWSLYFLPGSFRHTDNWCWNFTTVVFWGCFFNGFNVCFIKVFHFVGTEPLC